MLLRERSWDMGSPVVNKNSSRGTVKIAIAVNGAINLPRSFS